ncbi:hypothetical protein ZIOFF_023868 [Zingiber officinale]|uniref:Uncharacterized protein n=1 Tax=Zingiber officinale TaxID=94328 RepID=A0A8J5GZL5_ZINOF|nr:hypothetical protein ZIOFF_023868 [Zingiber officinale]
MMCYITFKYLATADHTVQIWNVDSFILDKTLTGMQIVIYCSGFCYTILVPFIEKVLQQPFFTTDLLYKLVKECVAMLDHLFPSNNLSISAECDGQNGVPNPTQSGERVSELEEIKYMQSLYMKSTVAALRSLKQIRSKNSTVKTD